MKDNSVRDMKRNHLNQTYNIFDNEYYSNRTKKEHHDAANMNNNPAIYNKPHYTYTEIQQPNTTKNGFNFFNQAKGSYYTKPIIQNKSNLTNTYNSNEISRVFVDAYKPTYQEKNLIPNPKQKIKGARNPFISQIKIV